MDSPRRSSEPTLVRRIYDTELDYVWNTLRRLGIRDADVEDVAHEVFLTVYRKLDDYDRTRPIRAWLFGFAYRIASEHRRRPRASREVLTDFDVEMADGAPLPDERLAAEQDRELVLRALDQIELVRRAVFVMHEIDGHPIPAVAEALGIPLNTAYSRLRVARDEFATAVDKLRAIPSRADKPTEPVVRGGTG